MCLIAMFVTYSLGFAISGGPEFGTYILEHYGLERVFQAACGIVGICLVLIILIPESRQHDTNIAKQPRMKPVSFTDQYRTIAKNKYLFKLMLMSMFVNLNTVRYELLGYSQCMLLCMCMCVCVCVYVVAVASLWYVNMWYVYVLLLRCFDGVFFLSGLLWCG